MRLLLLSLLLLVAAANEVDEWFVVLRDGPAALTTLRATGEANILRHEQIGSYHLYVLQSHHEAMARAFRSGLHHDPDRVHGYGRNHPVGIETLIQKSTNNGRLFGRGLPADTTPPIMVNGRHAACRSATGGGYQAGSFSWGVDRLDSQTPAYSLDRSFCTDGDGSGVHAYVIDTGVAPNHVTFRHGASQDYSWFTSDNRPTGDCHGHGTHVGGLIASEVYGVAPGAQLHAIQVLGCDGLGNMASIAAGLLYVMQYGQKPGVINLSLGAQGAHDSTVTTLIRQLRTQHGYSVVAAAGNLATDACTFFPASIPEAVTVAAVDVYDAQASFSNVGPCVDLFAPGVQLVSAAPGSPTASALHSGTSQAAPLVSGALSLIAGTHPNDGPATWEQRLQAQWSLPSAVRLNSAAQRLRTTQRLLHQNGEGFTLPPPNTGSSEDMVASILVVVCLVVVLM
jgi:hypothetical protein